METHQSCLCGGDLNLLTLSRRGGSPMYVAAVLKGINEGPMTLSPSLSLFLLISSLVRTGCLSGF